MARFAGEAVGAAEQASRRDDARADAGAEGDDDGVVDALGRPAAVLGHPATGVAWLAGKLAQHGASLAAGETILAGSFTRPIWIERGDDLLADYKELGIIACRFA